MILFTSSIDSLSQFKLSQLLQKLAQDLNLNSELISEFTEFAIRDCYYIKLDNSKNLNTLNSYYELLDNNILKKLLNLSGLYTSDSFANNNNLLIGPRKTTISSWSSKATEVVRLAGFDKVNKLEKYKLISWNFKKNNFFNKQQLSQVLNNNYNKYREIFDPLLESIYLNYHDLFNQEVNSTDKLTDKSDYKVEFYNLTESSNISDSSDNSYQSAYDYLEQINKNLNLALSSQELDYLVTYCKINNHQLTDVELMMFAQANSEHCRHKIFNASWEIDGEPQDSSLFQMIKHTYKCHSENIIKAYNDNGAILTGFNSSRLWSDSNDNYKYNYKDEASHIVIKVETHNHPTAIAPFPGSATGSGGEIRDEAATGRGAQAKAGLVGFTVSSLNNSISTPSSMQTGLTIMLDGPIGAARYNNEFGRPSIVGYFRDFYYQHSENKYYGYHKPIMLAGGLGNIRDQYVYKQEFGANNLVIVLGGPAMLIGLGGGAASSSSANLSANKLDFASVQRDNPEMQRRCQEVINKCWQDDDNPILSIHDVGAGGLSNAVPEIINDSKCGAKLDISKIPTYDSSMSALELWCNEAQERYILVIAKQSLEKFANICQRENCPYAVLGETTQEQNNSNNKLILSEAINTNLDLLFGNTPVINKTINNSKKLQSHNLKEIQQLQEHKSRIKNNFAENCIAILKHPTVGSKQYLITIGDRSVGGLINRDQMVGPYQVPVADCGVTLSDYTNHHGEAMAIGERTPMAVLDAGKAAKLAVGEAITNILAADIEKLSDVKLSANWMVASGDELEDHNLYTAVKTLGVDFCPKLGLTIPVGKDSMSMRTSWVECNNSNQQELEVKSPVSVVISAFAPVRDARKTLTPVLQDKSNAPIWAFDLRLNNNLADNILSGSIYSVINDSLIINNTSDQDFRDTLIDINTELLKSFVDCIIELKNNNLLLAYHDRSDGGFWVSLCEMAFASQLGLDINLNNNLDNTSKLLFNEALGAVVQLDLDNKNNLSLFNNILTKYNLNQYCYPIAELNNSKNININTNNQNIFSAELKQLQVAWHETSYYMQKLRDNPLCAEQEYNSIELNSHSLINTHCNFTIAPPVYNNYKPKAAILREQGTNGHIEMAAALMRAGFECVDVHLNDIIYNKLSLDNFNFLAVCGGFSYGDVLGAGRGFASRILYNNYVRDEFAKFFERTNTLTLGVCNGCQMLSLLQEIIPGANNLPKFINNQSSQFEARLSAVRINKSKAIMLDKMADSVLPIVVSHGEGQVVFETNNADANICLQYVDTKLNPTETYPANPNGSPHGVTGLCSDDGRVLIMMPHPERVFRTTQMSWCPDEWKQSDDSPWMQMFYNAYSYF